MNIYKCLIIGSAVVLFLSGCSTARIEDLKDCVTLSAGYGIGLDATAKAGFLFHPSIGLLSETKRYGIENRNVPSKWSETQVVSPLYTLVGIVFGDSDTPPFLSYSRKIKSRHIYKRNIYETCWFPIVINPGDRDPLAFHEITDIELGFTLIAVSVRAGINPLEIVDYILGYFGKDIAGDDPKENEANHGLESTGAPPAAGTPETHP